MTPIKTAPFDAAEYLDSEEAIAAYLSAALEEDDPALFLAALADVAKARGMTQMAKVLPATGFKPTDGFDKTSHIEDDDDAAHVMLKQMLGQAAPPNGRRVYIGGDMLKLQLIPHGLRHLT